MPRPEPSARRPLSREDLPAEFTAETLRQLDFRTLRRLSQPDNGVLDRQEQQQFDEALAGVVRGTTNVVNESLQRARRGGPGNLDPAMRRSYQRTQRRLAEQAGRAREYLPELALDALPEPENEPDVSTVTEEVHDESISPGTLLEEVEQSSDTLDMLERIASLQQQQLEHQQRQLLSETRGLFFAFLVSVAVLVAGVAPLVEADPHDRLLIALWTVAAIAAAGLVYTLVRGVQGKK
ncbi:hypothetical protein ACPPVT_18275 [Angustibacter sp. McL0619]|uniref:hypothetical protein n=1 Tax=Angustibacter sp. McL0619 TaxID=3415676 RepID=UPI003CF60A9D